MKKAASILLAFCLLLGLLPAAAAEDASFSDVAPGAYYAEAVQWAVEQGITAGTSATTFSPDDTCTRGQIMTFLWRAAGAPEKLTWNTLNDVPKGAYYEKAALWGLWAGLFSHYTFEPEAPCTRAMAVEFLWRLEGRPEASAPAAFSDVPADGNLPQAVAWAVERGITSGTGGTNFSPDEPCTRAQIATLLHRAFEHDAPGGTPVTELSELDGTYVGQHFTITAKTTPLGLVFEIKFNAQPDSEPAIEGRLNITSDLIARWNGLEMTFYQEGYLLLEVPDDQYSPMVGMYIKQ